MTTKPSTPPNQKHFTTMLKVAGELGCQLQPTPERPSILRGFCPFHPADTISNAKTLMLNVVNGRFWCLNCPADGAPTAFLARTWHVTASDARALMDSDPSAGADRPQYPEDFFNAKADNPQPPRLNTAILTRAARFYTSQIKTNYTPLHFLARLGVHPDLAATISVGYCSGSGLQQYLANNGINQDEIANSPLFQEVTGLEIFSGRLTITDTDHTGAAMWMTSFPPDQPSTGYNWKTSANPTMGIPGRKPYLFNMSNIDLNSSDVVLTDDHRLYIALRAENQPAILITQRRRDHMDLERHVRRIVQALLTKDIKSLIIPMHDKQLREEIENALAQQTKAPKQVSLKTRLDILTYLNLGSRHLASLIAPLPCPEKQDPLQEETPAGQDPTPDQDLLATLDPVHQVPQALDTAGDSTPPPEDRSVEENQ